MPHYLHEGGDVNCGGPNCLAVLASRERELAERKKIEEQLGNHSCQNIDGTFVCGSDDYIAEQRYESALMAAKEQQLTVDQQEATQQEITAQNKQLQQASDTAHNLAFKTTIATAPACLGSAVAAFIAPPAAVPLGIICATGTASALGFEVTSEILRPPK